MRQSAPPRNAGMQIIPTPFVATSFGMNTSKASVVAAHLEMVSPLSKTHRRPTPANPHLHGITLGERIQRAAQPDLAPGGPECRVVRNDNASSDCHHSVAQAVQSQPPSSGAKMHPPVPEILLKKPKSVARNQGGLDSSADEIRLSIDRFMQEFGEDTNPFHAAQIGMCQKPAWIGIDKFCPGNPNKTMNRVPHGTGE